MQKKILMWIIVSLFLVGVVNATVYFNDTFNRADSAIVGNGWNETESAGITMEINSNKFLSTDTTALSGDITQSITDITNDNNLVINYTFAYSSLTVGNGPFQNFYDDGNLLIRTAMLYATGTLVAYDGASVVQLKNLTSSVEYIIELVNIDFTLEEYDVKIDGVLYDNGGSHFGFFSSYTDGIDEIQFNSGSSARNTYTINDIYVGTELISGSNLTISATDSYNGSTLNISAEVVYNGTTYNFNGTSIDTGLSNDSYLANITINSDGYDTRTFTNYNISSNLNTQLNLTLGRFVFDDNVKDFEGNVISDYNVTITDLDNASEYTCTGVSNDAICYVPKNRDYNIDISSYGYTSDNINQSYNDSVYINVNNFSLYTFNSIRIEVYDFDSLNLITQNVTIRTIGDGVALLNSTLTGNITLDFLTPYTYELRFSSDNYNAISKFITVVNDSTQLLRVYMTANTSTELQLIEVVDQNIFPIEGAIVWIQEENLDDDGNFLTIQESETNTDGIANVWVEKDVTKYYRFAVVIDGESKPILPNGNYFTTKTVFIPGVTETLRLVVDNTGTSTDVITPIVEPIGELSITGTQNNTFTFTWIDGSNSISGAKLVIYSKFLNSSMDYEYVVTNSSSETSGTLTYTMPVLNNTAYRADAYFIYATRDQLVDSKEQVFDIDIFIDKNLGLLYAVFIVASAALLTVTFGALVSVLLTITSLILLVKLNLIFLPISIITGLLALGIIMFTKLKRSL